MEMTAEEICRNYRQAANPTMQIGILADLNVTSRNAIKMILEECGIAVKQSKRKGRKSTVWTEEREQRLAILAEKRVPQKEIAKELGLARSTVSRKLSEIKRAPQLIGTTTEQR